MRIKKINLNKILSYLLIFSVLFTTVQIGSISKVSAEAVTQVPGLTVKAGDQTKMVDLDAKGNAICEYLPPVKEFTLTTDAGYKITDVKSNSTKMTVGQVGNGEKTDYVVNSITDYSDFILTVTMTNPAGKVVTYPITMRFETDASLQFGTLRVTLDSQTPRTFKYGQTDGNGNYTIPGIDASVKTAKIELLDSNMTPMTFNVNGGSTNVVNLVGGDNEITITRTYLNTSKDYKLIITKKGEAKLQGLVPSAGALTPAFSGDVYNYSLTVPTTQTDVYFTPTAVDNSSTIKVNGSTVKSGSRSKNISLDEGDNEVQVVVATEDGNETTYNINVTRTALFRSAQLTGLTLTAGTLSPAFNKGIYEYTAIVENSVTSIGVTPTAEDANATILVNGKQIPSGATSPNISLDQGGNIIKVVVTDTKGNSNTYVLNITRKYPKDNVNLASLSVTDGVMSPKFDPESYLYSVKVPRYTEKVKVLYTLQNDGSKIKINGKDYSNGQSDSIKLELGANLITVEITAEDGKSTTTYKLSVIRGDVEGKDQWVLVAGNWTFYNAAGVQIKNEWVKYDNQWYFLDINGYRKTGWIQESGNWFYLNNDGIMQTGWLYDKGYWYYLQGNGAMRKNVWATYDGKWYFFNNFGQMQTGWTLYLGNWYYMDDHGVMQKGWVTYDKNKYYLNDDGTLRTGWLYNGRTWSYLDSAGVMVRGWQTIDGRRYYFDANGAMKTGMLFLDGQWINLNNV